MTNECKTVRGLLALRPDEWSDPERRLVQGHLGTCPDCAALARAYAEQDRLIRATPRLVLTPAQRAQLFSRIQGTTVRRHVYTRLSTVAGTTLAAVALVALALGLLTLLQGMDRRTSDVPASAYPRSGSRITFTSWRDGNGEIYLMGTDGAGLIRLTNNPERDSDPVWSPDGTRLAFVSWQDGGNQEIYVAQVGGAKGEIASPEPINLTNHPATDEAPTWSPDGTQIAFTSWRDGNQEIYAVNADGTGLTNLTNDPAEDSSPAWSPPAGGQWIAFTSVRDGVPGIYVIPAPWTSAGAAAPIRLTSGSGGGDSLWSPDGKRIAFVSKSSNGNTEIYMLDVAAALEGSAGAESVRLTNNPATDVPIAWSPEGTQLAFETDRDGNWEIYIVNADGSGLTRLTADPAEDRAPSWSPDGAQIAFASDRDGNWEI
ncbi:MAG: hypothetical protein KJ734_12015, partial [Chloroflexi bacterium]|nr:hypothetical protein [Chloroflexota bacterium]